MMGLGGLLAGVLLASLGACSGGTSGGAPLLRDVPPPAASRPAELAVKRSRFVAIDLAALRRPSTCLDLFPGSAPGVLTVVWSDVQQPSPETRAWTGQAREIADSTVTLVVNDAERVVVGTIRVAAGLYRIRYVGTGIHVVQELDPRGFPKD